MTRVGGVLESFEFSYHEFFASSRDWILSKCFWYRVLFYQIWNIIQWDFDLWIIYLYYWLLAWNKIIQMVNFWNKLYSEDPGIYSLCTDLRWKFVIVLFSGPKRISLIPWIPTWILYFAPILSIFWLFLNFCLICSAHIMVDHPVVSFHMLVV